MNTNALRGCALGLTPQTLSAWRDGALPASEARRVNAHIATCDACQARLAEYEELARGLAAIRAPEPVGGYGRNPRMRTDMPRGNPSKGRALRIGRLGALAAVALLALAFAQLLRTHGHSASPIATATPSQTTATVALCDKTKQVLLSVIDDRVVGGHEGYGVEMRNSSATACLLQGYPEVTFAPGAGQPPISVVQALQAPTYQTTGPTSIVLQPNDQNAADFYLDWQNSTTPGGLCSSAQGFDVKIVGAMSVGGTLTPLVVCGPVSVSPFVPASRPTAPPPSAVGLPTCQIAQLSLASVQVLPTNLTVTPARVGNVYALTNVGAAPCVLDGYPILRLYNDQRQPLPLPVQQTTSAPTYQAQPPQPLPLGAGDSVYFSIDYSTAPSPGDTCNVPIVVSVTPPGVTGDLVMSSALNSCGSMNVSPLRAHP